jgi:hypothetical protein
LELRGTAESLAVTDEASDFTMPDETLPQPETPAE